VLAELRRAAHKFIAEISFGVDVFRWCHPKNRTAIASESENTAPMYLQFV
jgi:hypothetical protein